MRNLTIKKIIKKIVFYFDSNILLCKILLKRKIYGNLVVLISTAYWGNVGDHAIVFGEKEVIRLAGYEKRIIDIDSVQYIRFSKLLKKIIHKDDIIIIDGGGNFGDVWPETQRNINSIISTYIENRIVVFPESWYFTDSKEGQRLLSDTINIISQHKNIVIYARDSFSYKMMKKNLNNTDIRQSLDTVFMINFSITSEQSHGVALVVRDDKETINKKFSKTILEKELNKKGINCFEIKNDCYSHISKKKRKKYIQSILEQYKNAELVITDRFHGMVFSILCNKPCIIIDNKTGKVKNSFEDIKNYINGILYVNDKNNTIQDILEYIWQEPVLTISKEFKEKIKNDKDELISTIKGENYEN